MEETDTKIGLSSGVEIQRYDSYKDSGIEWLGDIPEHWEVIKLKFLSEIKTGEKDTVDRNDDGQYPFFIRSKNVQRIHTYSYDEEAVLTAGDGDIGKIFHYINGKFEYHQRVYKFSGFRKIIAKCLYYYLHYNLAEEVVKLSAKTTVDSLRLPMLQNFFVAVPPLPEQTAISQFLEDKTTKIDQAIAIKQQQIALLKERKQILIHKAVTRGLDDSVALKDSGVEWIGEIPAHWQFIKVKNIFRLVIEPAAKNNDYELLSVYTDIGVKPRKELEERGNKASTTDGYWLVKKGDIVVNKLLAWMGAIGISDYNGVTSPAYDILRPTRPIAGYFYHNLFRTPNCKSELKKHSRGIMDMRLRLYFDKFGNVKVPYPPFNEQKEIVEYIETASAKIETAISIKEQEIEKLQEYKSSLINSVVTGKVRVC